MESHDIKVTVSSAKGAKGKTPTAFLLRATNEATVIDCDS